MSTKMAINLPGAFCDWFDDTGLVSGADDSDPACKTTRLAYEAGARRNCGAGYYIRVMADATVARLLAEYADSCLVANQDEPLSSENKAARKAIGRSEHAHRILTKQES